MRSSAGRARFRDVAQNTIDADSPTRHPSPSSTDIRLIVDCARKSYKGGGRAQQGASFSRIFIMRVTYNRKRIQERSLNPRGNWYDPRGNSAPTAASNPLLRQRRFVLRRTWTCNRLDTASAESALATLAARRSRVAAMEERKKVMVLVLKYVMPRLFAVGVYSFLRL